jgi:hypothetical protein
MTKSLEIERGGSGADRSEAIELVRQSGLVEHLAAAAGGPFGQTSLTLGLLEALVDAVDLALRAGERLEAAILEDLSGAASFALPRLGPEHRQLVASFELAVVADALTRRVEALCGVPAVEGALEAEGLRDLLQGEGPRGETLGRALRLARSFAGRRPSPAAAPEVDACGALVAREGGGAAAIGAIMAFFLLLRRAVLNLSRTTSVRPLVAALEARRLTVGGYPYQGLEVREPSAEATGLLPVRPDDIVGNEAFCRAGLRLARDVAGYDLERRINPKRLNPVLFGLGRPGCGKTVTAHAIGNYFLDYCRSRGLPARFLVVRRTDWASSYQNASARNLVRFFREEVHGFDGVAGVYWPDIDTAFASRDSEGLRQEEKQNLGAVFGIFDGTLLPRDGKWFLICDANTLHMDEATISRIAQNPFRVEGPTGAADYIRLMRDVMLRDLSRFLPGDEAVWQRVGELAAALDLSGRNVDSVCSNLRAHVQDFDYPDEYFDAADAAERDRIVAALGRPVDEGLIVKQLEDYAAFRRSAEAEAEGARFEREVEAIVRRLNASRAAAALAGE